MNIVIDIETLPTMREDVIADIRANVKPPATYKKPESIAEWIKTEGEAAAEQEVRRTALDGAYGRVCVIGWAVDDQPAAAIYSEENEPMLLQALNNAFERIPPTEYFTTTIIGHNVAEFDLRFLVQRFIVNGIQPHMLIGRAAQAKPWEGDKVFDTMVQWAGTKNRVSLDKLCKALSIPTPKADITGATVYDAVMSGRIAEVAEYCKRDVEATRLVYERMKFLPQREAA